MWWFVEEGILPKVKLVLSLSPPFYLPSPILSVITTSLKGLHLFVIAFTWKSRESEVKWSARRACLQHVNFLIWVTSVCYQKRDNPALFLHWILKESIRKSASQSTPQFFCNWSFEFSHKLWNSMCFLFPFMSLWHF